MARDYVSLPEPLQYQMQKNREYLNKKSFKSSEAVNNKLREEIRKCNPKPLNETIRKYRSFEYCEPQCGRVSNFFRGLGKGFGKFLKFIK